MFHFLIRMVICTMVQWGRLEWNAADLAEKIILQVNKYQPRVQGFEHRIHISKVSHICEFDHALPPLPQPEPTEVDKKIAELMLSKFPMGQPFKSESADFPMRSVII